MLEPEVVVYSYFQSVSIGMMCAERARHKASGLRRAPDEFYDQRLLYRQWNQMQPALGRFHQASGAGHPLVNGHEDGSGLERLFETICDIEAHLITDKN